MSIYTKTGDKGKTNLFNGQKILKSSKLIQAIGATDELNSYLGVVGKLTEIQRNLFTINSILSGAKLALPKDATKKLEKEIDKMESKMPKQKNFLIYGGCLKSRQLFYARALCRRAERTLVSCSSLYAIRYTLIAYINRLSDYLFTLARYTNFKKKIKEEIWKV